jgi:hypothetical protein
LPKNPDYEYFDTELIITSDSTNDVDNSKILDAIRRTDSSISSILHTVGTNVIVVSGRCSESDLNEKVDKMSEIPGVHVNIGKKQRVVIRSPKSENISISEHVGWSFTKNVIGDISREIEARSYFKAISTSCQYFQVLGKQLLGKNVKEFQELPQIINSLHSRNIIDEETCRKMHNLREYQNPIEHEGAGFQFNSEEARKAEKLATEALNICKLLEGKK